MPVTTKNGLTYRITFNYTPMVNTFGRSYEKTACDITTRVEDDRDVTVGFGEVALHQNDTPNRKVARKEALKKAMQDAEFDRATRSEIWNALNLRH